MTFGPWRCLRIGGTGWAVAKIKWPDRTLSAIYGRLNYNSRKAIAMSNAFERARSEAVQNSADLQERNRLWWEKMPMTYGDWQADDRKVPETPGDFRSIEHILLSASPFLREEFDYDALAGKDVLDIGCGSGVLSCLMARRGARVSAVDITDQGVRMCARNASVQGIEVKVVRGDAERLPLADDSFDYVLSWGVLHHSSDTERAVREVGRVLRPGGRGLIMVYHKTSLFYYLKGLWWLIARGKIFSGHTLKSVTNFFVDGFYHRHFTAGEMEACLRQGGLTPKSVFATQQQEPILPLLPGFLDKPLKRRFGWYLVAEFAK